jgi:hypothetical protein
LSDLGVLLMVVAFYLLSHGLVKFAESLARTQR